MDSGYGREGSVEVYSGCLYIVTVARLDFISRSSRSDRKTYTV